MLELHSEVIASLITLTLLRGHEVGPPISSTYWLNFTGVFCLRQER